MKPRRAAHGGAGDLSPRRDDLTYGARRLPLADGARQHSTRWAARTARPRGSGPLASRSPPVGASTAIARCSRRRARRVFGSWRKRPKRPAVRLDVRNGGADRGRDRRRLAADHRRRRRPGRPPTAVSARWSARLSAVRGSWSRCPGSVRRRHALVDAAPCSRPRTGRREADARTLTERFARARRAAPRRGRGRRRAAPGLWRCG
jgi:hypothetical protein